MEDPNNPPVVPPEFVFVFVVPNRPPAAGAALLALFVLPNRPPVLAPAAGCIVILGTVGAADAVFEKRLKGAGVDVAGAVEAPNVPPNNEEPGALICALPAGAVPNRPPAKADVPGALAGCDEALPNRPPDWNMIFLLNVWSLVYEAVAVRFQVIFGCYICDSA